MTELKFHSGDLKYYLVMPSRNETCAVFWKGFKVIRPDNSSVLYLPFVPSASLPPSLTYPDGITAFAASGLGDLTAD